MVEGAPKAKREIKPAKQRERQSNQRGHFGELPAVEGVVRRRGTADRDRFDPITDTLPPFLEPYGEM